MTQLVNVRSFPLVDRRRILPDDVVYIGRAVPRVGLKASPWANPYRRTDAVKRIAHWPQQPDWLVTGVLLGMYADWLAERLAAHELDLEQLRGRTLACWCPPAPCHGSVILDWLERHPVVPAGGERIHFGLHRMPVSAAEGAAAWPDLSTFARRFDDAYRRHLRKASHG